MQLILFIDKLREVRQFINKNLKEELNGVSSKILSILTASSLEEIAARAIGQSSREKSLQQKITQNQSQNPLQSLLMLNYLLETRFPSQQNPKTPFQKSKI